MSSKKIVVTFLILLKKLSFSCRVIIFCLINDFNIENDINANLAKIENGRVPKFLHNLIFNFILSIISLVLNSLNFSSSNLIIFFICLSMIFFSLIKFRVILCNELNKVFLSFNDMFFGNLYCIYLLSSKVKQFKLIRNSTLS